jgi:hypothetical protein
MGSASEARPTQEMINFCAEHGIVNDVEIIPIPKLWLS